MMLFLTVPDSEALGVADLPAWSYAHKPMVDIVRQFSRMKGQVGVNDMLTKVYDMGYLVLW